jgi:hypothetical protein
MDSVGTRGLSQSGSARHSKLRTYRAGGNSAQNLGRALRMHRQGNHSVEAQTVERVFTSMQSA